MSQTDPRAVAYAVIADWKMNSSGGYDTEMNYLEKSIAHALADAERRGMERAAGIARDHECDIGCICRIEIALKLRAQAQADKEG